MKKIALALIVIFCVSSMAFAWPWSKKSEEKPGKGAEQKAKMMQKKETKKAKIMEKKTEKKTMTKKKVEDKKKQMEEKKTMKK